MSKPADPQTESKAVSAWLSVLEEEVVSSNSSMSHHHSYVSVSGLVFVPHTGSDR